MLKTKRFNIVLVAIVIFSMAAMYGYMPTVNAAAMQAASVTLGDSDVSQTATSTVTFNLVGTLPADGYIRVTFESDFAGIAAAQVDCNTGGVASTTGDVVDCTYAAGLDTSEHTLDIQVQNPGTTGAKDVTVAAINSGATELESTQVKVFIISDVDVTAHVDATLTFAISGTTTGMVINGATTTVDTSGSATSLPFGDLEVGTTTILAQGLSVTTNAGSGFSVTVQRDGDLENAAGDTINAFVDGTAASDTAWASPTGDVADPDSYGHMGVTATDYADVAELSVGTYLGLDGTTAQEVMSHTSVANGTGNGYAGVAYAIEISSLQEAGDYTSTLTYVCTPTY